jgi:lipoprotein-anchoring transpeptidase ErfK/SrfK
MSRRRMTLAAAAAALACAAPAGAQVPLPPLGGSPPPEQGQPQPQPQPEPEPQPDPEPQQPGKPRKPVYAAVSNERTRTLWGHAVERATARKRPRRSAHRVARLRYDTEDGFAEVYLVLARYTDAKGRQWLKVRLPMRPNGRTGWVPRRAISGLHTVNTFLRVDRHSLRATLYRGGRRVWRAPVGIGNRGTETPGGRFYIRERLRVPSRSSLYGPLAFGTSAYSKLTDWPGGGVVGIHGTNAPALIPGRPSHGCVRLRNRDIVRLGRLMPIGTPVRIR